MASLRMRFRARLVEDLSRMEELASGAPTPTDLNEIQTIGHKLAGISGSLGFDEVTLAARSLDRAWHPTTEDFEELHGLLENLVRAVRQIEVREG